MRLVKRSGRKIVAPPAPTPITPEAMEANHALAATGPLALAIALGFRCRALLDSGEYAAQGDLAKHLGITRGYVSRMTRLTLLAPDIIDAILDGREPDGLSVEALSVEELLVAWEVQQKRFGFPEVG